MEKLRGEDYEGRRYSAALVGGIQPHKPAHLYADAIPQLLCLGSKRDRGRGYRQDSLCRGMRGGVPERPFPRLEKAHPLSAIAPGTKCGVLDQREAILEVPLTGRDRVVW